MSHNYDYMVEKSISFFPDYGAVDRRFLDFGCGSGQIVARGITAGLDFYGADPYHNPVGGAFFHDVKNQESSTLGERIHKINDGVIDFPDNHFDMVVSNVVFEHVVDLEQALSEIRRVLKPGGVFLAIFPTRGTWFEGHCNLYFAHWLNPGKKYFRQYIALTQKLGLGRKKPGQTPEQWAEIFHEFFVRSCHYRSDAVIDRNWRSYFNAPLMGMEDDFFLYRIKKSRFSAVHPFFDNMFGKPLAALLCRIRGGRVIMIRNGKPQAS